MRGSHLSTRGGLGWRWGDGGVLRPAGRRPHPGQHHPAPGPPHATPRHPTPDSHRHRSRRDHRTSRESVRPSPALGLPAQRRRRACAVASVPEGAQPASDTCVQQVPARGPAPAWRSPLPLRLRPALSGREAPPTPGAPGPAPRGATAAWARAGAPTEIFKIGSSFPGSRSRVPARAGGLRHSEARAGSGWELEGPSVERWSRVQGARRGRKGEFKTVEIALEVTHSPKSLLLPLQP